MTRIFISYKSDDRAFATELREQLQQWGYETWIDVNDIPKGAYWPDEIDKGLRECDVVLGVMSRCAVESRNVKNEWDWAIVNGKQFNTRLILIKLEACIVPMNYVSINYIDFNTSNRTNSYRTLEDTLKVSTAPTNPDDPYRVYLETLYTRINDILGRVLPKALHHPTKRPEPIVLTPETSPGAVDVLFEKREDIDPLFASIGIASTQQKHFKDFSEAFEYFNGRLLLLGSPGAGKTVTLLYHARDAVVRRLHDPRAPLPILGNIYDWDSDAQSALGRVDISTKPDQHSHKT